MSEEYSSGNSGQPQSENRAQVSTFLKNGVLVVKNPSGEFRRQVLQGGGALKSCNTEGASNRRHSYSQAMVKTGENPRRTARSHSLGEISSVRDTPELCPYTNALTVNEFLTRYLVKQEI